MYNVSHPVYPVLQRIGKEITQKVKPKAVVVFSGHWMGKRDAIEINSAEKTDLIYESVPRLPHDRVRPAKINPLRSFYGFPDSFYKAQYPNKGSPELASKISTLLSTAGIKNQGVKRGLDHGVWAGFHVGKSTRRIKPSAGP
jgi:4,5-DOPA dioxygenase extradiol